MSEDVTVTVHPAVKVVLERTGTGWSAYVPSVLGCIATARSRREVERLIEEGLTLHLELLHEDGVKEIAEEIAREAAETAPRR